MGQAAGEPRLRRTDAGSLLLEAIVAIAVVSIVMVAVTGVMVTGTRSSAHNRDTQAAVQIATSALDAAQAHGIGALSQGATTRTVNGVVFTTTYTTCAADTTDAACLPAGTRGPYARVTAQVSWAGTACPAAGCRYRATTVLNTQPDLASVPGDGPELRQPPDVSTALGQALSPIALVATGVSAPPVVFEGSVSPVDAGASCGAVTAPGSSLVSGAGQEYGIELDPETGVITGTPTRFGRFCLSVAVTDAAQRSSSARFMIDVRPECYDDFGLVIRKTAPYWDGSDTNPSVETYSFRPKQIPACVGGDITYRISDARYTEVGAPAPNGYPWENGILKCPDEAAPMESYTDPYGDVDLSDGSYVPTDRSLQVCTNTDGLIRVYNNRPQAIYCVHIEMDDRATGDSYDKYLPLRFIDRGDTQLPDVPPACRSAVTP